MIFCEVELRRISSNGIKNQKKEKYLESYNNTIVRVFENHKNGLISLPEIMEFLKNANKLEIELLNYFFYF